MPKTPPPPKKKQEKISFPNPDLYEQKINLHKEIRQTLLQLREILPNPKDRDTILKFADCISLSSRDVSRLPYVSNKPAAKHRNKSACLFALISWLIRKYWDYCEEGMASLDCPLFVGIKDDLKKLKEIIKIGFQNYKVAGNPAGYYLEKK